MNRAQRRFLKRKAERAEQRQLVKAGQKEFQLRKDKVDEMVTKVYDYAIEDACMALEHMGFGAVRLARFREHLSRVQVYRGMLVVKGENEVVLPDSITAIINKLGSEE